MPFKGRRRNNVKDHLFILFLFSQTHFLMGSELLHKRNDFVDALMGWRRHSALTFSTEELMMEPYFWDSVRMDWWASEFKKMLFGHGFG
jgi:hypothetical protein